MSKNYLLNNRSFAKFNNIIKYYRSMYDLSSTKDLAYCAHFLQNYLRDCGGVITDSCYY